MNIMDKIYEARQSYAYNNRTHPEVAFVGRNERDEIIRFNLRVGNFDFTYDNMEVFGMSIIVVDKHNFLGFGSDCSNSLGEQNAN